MHKWWQMKTHKLKRLKFDLNKLLPWNKNSTSKTVKKEISLLDNKDAQIKVSSSFQFSWIHYNKQIHDRITIKKNFIFFNNIVWAISKTIYKESQSSAIFFRQTEKLTRINGTLSKTKSKFRICWNPVLPITS